VRQLLTAAIFSAELPELLLPAALESIQKGQVTICAARIHIKCLNSADKRLLLPGAEPRALLATKMSGQCACIPEETDWTPNTLSAASTVERISAETSSPAKGGIRAITAPPMP